MHRTDPLHLAPVRGGSHLLRCYVHSEVESLPAGEERKNPPLQAVDKLIPNQCKGRFHVRSQYALEEISGNIVRCLFVLDQVEALLFGDDPWRELLWCSRHFAVIHPHTPVLPSG